MRVQQLLRTGNNSIWFRVLGLREAWLFFTLDQSVFSASLLTTLRIALVAKLVDAQDLKS
jgi:hypothetical protein